MTEISINENGKFEVDATRIDTPTAINWAKERLSSPPSLETQRQYKKVVARLMNLNRNPADGVSSRNTRSVERSACRFYAATVILEKYEHDPQYAENIYAWISKIDTQALSDQLLANNKVHERSVNKEKCSMRQVRQSKRKSLVGLESDWRQKLLKAVEGSKYAKQIQLMMVCGCRPVEMAKGIQVERDNGVFRITIQGAKISDWTAGGQEIRVLDIAEDHPLLVGLESGDYQASARGIENAVEHFALKLWPFRKEKVSAYTLRHAAATDFKSGGLSRQEVAAALGHQSIATMSHYGTSNRTKGGLNLVAVTATNPVRVPILKSKYAKLVSEKSNSNKRNMV